MSSLTGMPSINAIHPPDVEPTLGRLNRSGHRCAWLAGTAAVIGLTLTGCFGPTEAEKAERSLKMIESVGTADEICDAARAVANAYLEAGDDEKFQTAHLSASIKCNRAALDRLAR